MKLILRGVKHLYFSLEFSKFCKCNCNSESWIDIHSLDPIIKYPHTKCHLVSFTLSTSFRLAQGSNIGTFLWPRCIQLLYYSMVEYLFYFKVNDTFKNLFIEQENSFTFTSFKNFFRISVFCFIRPMFIFKPFWCIKTISYE